MTDEEMKQYADDHWKCVVLCREFKHLTFTGGWHDWCEILMIPVKNDFWCRNGEKRK